jgi:hypothetical protein
MSDIRKVNFTLPNGATFNAEGTEEYVDRLLERFTSMMQVAPQGAPNLPLRSFCDRGTTDSELPFDRLFSQDDYYALPCWLNQDRKPRC